MLLNDDLAAWVNDRPDWQKDAVARFCRNEILSDRDIGNIVDQLIKETYPESEGISAEDIPGSTSGAEPVTLKELSDVMGVNALLEDQNLSFSEEGITVIFGDNGAGKSGYARLIREAVTARVQGEELLSNVFAKEKQSQTAKLSYNTGVQASSWTLGEAQDRILSRIRFFDDKCGDSYVTQASEVDYQPSALTILDQLSDTVARVSTVLSQRLKENEAQVLNLSTIKEGTSAFEFVSNISELTTEEEILAATTLSSDHDEQFGIELEEEARLKRSDPKTEQQRLRGLSKDWKELENHGNAILKVLGSEGLAKLRTQRTRTKTLQEAAIIASQNSFDSEPLAHVGSEAWRTLWEAARNFSTSEAYHDHAYPHTEGESVCVLCQQTLSEEASTRLQRFEAFVKDTTSSDADAAIKELAGIRSRIAKLKDIPVSVMTAASRLQVAGESVSAELEYFETATKIAEKLIAWLDASEETEPDSLHSLPTLQDHQMSETRSKQATAIDSSTFAETLKVQTERVQELQDVKKLCDAQALILQEVQRLKERKQIDRARRVCNTNAITTKRVQLIEEYVTEAVKDQFENEVEHLKLNRVTINRTGRGRDRALEHQPQLVGSLQEADVHKVFSEGEQTALGLAGFITEVELDDSYSGVVFDDPVSSLDAGRRSQVAKRIVELAKKRQVIVFTHEITFVNALNREAKEQEIELSPRTVQRVGGSQPGKVTEEFPWQAKDIPKRINDLETDLVRLRTKLSDLTDEEYAKEIAPIVGRLSETLERAVNIHIVNELVDRGTNQVRPSMLKILPKFSEQDNREYQSFYGRTSSWAPRHDNAPEENYHPPTVDEVNDQVKWLKEWHKRIKSYAQ